MAGARLGQGAFSFAQLHGLSLVAYGVKVVLVAGLAWLLFDWERGGGDPIGRLLLIGVCAAGLLAYSVSLILRLARRSAPAGASA